VLQIEVFFENVKMILSSLVQTDVFAGNQAGSFGEPQGDGVGGFLTILKG